MKNEIINKGYSSEDVLDMCVTNLSLTYNGDNVIDEIREDFLKLDNTRKNTKARKELNDKILKGMQEVSIIYSTKSGHSFSEGINPRYVGYAIKMKEDLIKEYQSKTTIEISLIEQMVSSHIKIIVCSNKIEQYTSNMEYFSSQRNDFLKFLSIEKDRATRQFLLSMQTLQQIKQPALNIKINTKNAFIAQNQQLNNNEINEPK